ncbi:MAG: hypothetical protein ABJB98_05940 [Actinomycetota bacterium]
MRLQRAALTVTSVLMAGALAGCGGSTGGNGTPASGAASSATASSGSGADLSSLTAQQLLDKAKAELAAAKSFRVTGNAISDGTAVAVDMGFTAAGSAGSVTLGGAKIELRSIGQTMYFRAPDSFWRKQLGGKADVVLAVVSGKWIKTSPTDPRYADLGSFTSRQQFIDTLQGDASAGQMVKTDGKTIDGVDCLGLKNADSILYLAKDTARPIAAEPVPGTKDVGQAKFSDYDAVPEVTAPPVAETIDATKLGG